MRPENQPLQKPEERGALQTQFAPRVSGSHHHLPPASAVADETVITLGRQAATRAHQAVLDGTWTDDDCTIVMKAMEALGDQLMNRSRQVHFLAWTIRKILGETPLWQCHVSELVDLMKGGEQVTVTVDAINVRYEKRTI